VRLEELGKLKKSTRELPACSFVPQSTKLLRTPGINWTEHLSRSGKMIKTYKTLIARHE
jgi:hypothetical protein